MEMMNREEGYGPGSIEGWLRKGEAALFAKRNSEAAECFDQALKSDPFNAKAHTMLSRAFWAQGKTEDALNCLCRALELEPGHRDTVLECSRVFAELGKKDFSREVLETYLKANPTDDEARRSLESLSASCAAEGEQKTAGVAEIFQRQGEIQFERGKLSHAAVCFEIAIENNPLMAEAHSSLGVVRLTEGKINEALGHFYQALELDSESPEILGNSARALSRAGESEAALGMYREYLRRCPQDNDAWTEYEELVRRSVAVEWDLGESSPEVAGIYVETAKRLMEAGNAAGAAEAVEKALKIDPGASAALLVLASLHKSIGQNEEAVSVLQEALSLDPSSEECRAMLNSLQNGGGGEG